ncbi:MAG: GNAT family N-acetyltransferase [Bacteroidia bacterium]
MKLQSIHITLAETPTEIEAVRDLLTYYGELRNHDAALGDYPAELAALSEKYASPQGCLLLAKYEQQALGCVAFQALAADICEMKRMFVLPDYQGQGIGFRLVERLLLEAQNAGYQIMRLDTHPTMHRAAKLYQSMGFYPISRYNHNPTPGIRFFEKKL